MDEKLIETKPEEQIESDEEILGDDSEQQEEKSEGAEESETNKSEVDETEEEIIVSIGDEEPPKDEERRAPEWVRELRKQNREKEKRIKELEAKLNSSDAEKKPAQLGVKPKLEDFDYDADQYETALASWFERKRLADQEAEKARKAEEAQRAEWQARLDAYGKAKSELKVKDFEDAEAFAQEVFNVTQQGIVVQGAENPALVVYALGKNPKKAKELAQISDPVKFAFAVAKMEKELKVTTKKQAPPPERIVTGTGRVSGSVDSTLERLRAEAERTGDFTKVIRYKREKAAKQ